jgi:putative flippase GtrA
MSVIAELLGYAAVSVVALCADVLLLQFLVEQAGWHYQPASALAFVAGASIAYLISVRFVFRSRRLSNRTLEFSVFVALGMVGLVVNAAVLFVEVSLLGVSLLPAKLVAAVCTFGANFTLRRSYLFSPTRSVP